MNKYDVCVVGGCGHVGLPLSIALAGKGKKVCVYDINKSAIEMIGRGELPFFEEGAESVLKEALKDGNLILSNDISIISESDIVIFIIGTPVDEHLNPKFSLIKDMINDLNPYFKDGQLLILRSTVYPGISKKVHEWVNIDGKTIHVSFCPERILEGKAMTELETLPQIVSSFDKDGLDRSIELFKLLTDDIVVVEPMEAELTKLFTNVWRYIKFAVANQFYTIANDYDLDFYNIYYAMTHNYPRAQDFPKAGLAAGPCLFKDSMQLGAFNNSSFYLGHTAMLVNEGLPNYMVQRLKKKYDLNNMVVGILGMAFKGESDDIRESLSYKLKKILEVNSKKVICTDPYVKDKRLLHLDKVVEESDILIVATPHKVYKDLNIKDKNIVDIWNLFGKGGKI